MNSKPISKREYLLALAWFVGVYAGVYYLIMVVGLLYGLMVGDGLIVK